MPTQLDISTISFAATLDERSPAPGGVPTPVEWTGPSAYNQLLLRWA